MILPMVERMAAAYAEAELRDATDIEGNRITWESLGILRQRHVISCMRDVLKAMIVPSDGMISQGQRFLSTTNNAIVCWCEMLRFAADEMAADRLDDGERERTQQQILDILSKP